MQAWEQELVQRASKSDNLKARLAQTGLSQEQISFILQESTTVQQMNGASVSRPSSQTINPLSRSGSRPIISGQVQLTSATQSRAPSFQPLPQGSSAIRSGSVNFGSNVTRLPAPIVTNNGASTARLFTGTTTLTSPTHGPTYTGVTYPQGSIYGREEYRPSMEIRPSLEVRPSLEFRPSLDIRPSMDYRSTLSQNRPTSIQSFGVSGGFSQVQRLQPTPINTGTVPTYHSFQQSNVPDQGSKIQELTSELEKARTEIRTLQEKYSVQKEMLVQEEIEDQEKMGIQSKEYEEKIGRVKAEDNEYEAQLINQIRFLQSANQNLQSELNNLREAHHETTSTQPPVDVESIRAELQTQIDRLGQEINQRDQEIQKLRSDLQVNTDGNSQLVQQERYVSELITQVGVEKQEVAHAQENIQEKNRLISMLEQDLHKSNSQFNEIQRDLQIRADEIVHLRHALEGMSNNLQRQLEENRILKQQALHLQFGQQQTQSSHQVQPQIFNQIADLTRRLHESEFLKTQEIQSYASQIGQLTQSLQQAETDRTSLQQTIQQHLQQIATHTQRIHELETERRALEFQIEILNSRLTLDQQVTTQVETEEVKTLRSQIETLNARLTESNVEQSTTQTKTEETGVTEHLQKIAELTQKLSHVEDTEHKTQKQLRLKQQELDNMKTLFEQLTLTIETQKTEKQVLLEENIREADEINNEIEEHNKMVAEIERLNYVIQDMVREKEATQQGTTTQSQVQESSSVDVSQYTSQISQLTKRIHELEAHKLLANVAHHLNNINKVKHDPESPVKESTIKENLRGAESIISKLSQSNRHPVHVDKYVVQIATLIKDINQRASEGDTTKTVYSPTTPQSDTVQIEEIQDLIKQVHEMNQPQILESSNAHAHTHEELTGDEEATHLRNIIKSLEENLQRRDLDLRRAFDQIHGLTQMVHHFETQAHKPQQTNLVPQEEVQRLSGAIQQLRAEKVELLTKINQHESEKQNTNHLLEQVANLTKKIHEVDQHKGSSSQHIHMLESQISQLTDKLRTSEQDAIREAQEKNHALGEVNKYLEQISAFSRKLKEAESSTHSQSSHLASDNETLRQQLQHSHHEIEGLRGQINTLQQQTSQYHQSHQKLHVVESHRQELEAKTHHYLQNIAEMTRTIHELEVEANSRRQEAGSQPIHISQHDSQQQPHISHEDLETAKSKVILLTQEVTRAQDQLKESHQKESALAAQLQQVQNELAQLHSVSQRVASLDSDARKIQEDRAKLTDEENRLRTERESLEKEKKETLKFQEEVLNKNEQRLRKISEQDQEGQDSKSQKLEQELATVKEQRNRYSRTIDELEDVRRSLENELSDLKKRTIQQDKSYKEKLEKLEKTIEEQKKEIQRQKSTITRLEDEIEGLKKEHKKASDVLKESESNLFKISSSVKSPEHGKHTQHQPQQIHNKTQTQSQTQHSKEVQKSQVPEQKREREPSHTKGRGQGDDGGSWLEDSEDSQAKETRELFESYVAPSPQPIPDVAMESTIVSPSQLMKSEDFEFHKKSTHKKHRKDKKKTHHHDDDEDLYVKKETKPEESSKFSQYTKKTTEGQEKKTETKKEDSRQSQSQISPIQSPDPDSKRKKDKSARGRASDTVSAADLPNVKTNIVESEYVEKKSPEQKTKQTGGKAKGQTHASVVDTTSKKASAENQVSQSQPNIENPKSPFLNAADLEEYQGTDDILVRVSYNLTAVSEEGAQGESLDTSHQHVNVQDSLMISPDVLPESRKKKKKNKALKLEGSQEERWLQMINKK